LTGAVVGGCCAAAQGLAANWYAGMLVCTSRVCLLCMPT
jgi:hypothetical protein